MKREDPLSPGIQWIVWGGLGLTILTIAALFLGQRSVPSASSLPVFSQVAEFNLTNQLAAPAKLAHLLGHVWVADIIFTRCPGPCTAMTRHMKELQEAFAAASLPVKSVSLTTDPEFDTPAVLQAYASRFGANSDRWWFLTGTKLEIAQLAVSSLKLTAMDKAPEQQENPADLFIHSTIFVLVDKQGRLRSAIESLEPGWKERLLREARSLVREKSP